jgi:hypothetical protein
VREASYAIQRSQAVFAARRRFDRALTAAALSAFVAGNAAVIFWLWAHAGNLADDHGTGALLTSLGRLTAPQWTATLQGYEAMTILADETVLTTGGFPGV